MQIVMAGSAENQCLAATSSHDLDPEWLFPTVIGVQVFESPDMVGSGAVVPCEDHPSPALRTVRAPFDAHGSPFTYFLRDSLSGSVPA